MADTRIEILDNDPMGHIYTTDVELAADWVQYLTENPDEGSYEFADGQTVIHALKERIDYLPENE